MTAALAWLRAARWWFVLAVVMVLASAAGVQTMRLAGVRADLAALGEKHAKQEAADAVANADGLLRQATLQQENIHAFRTNMLALALKSQAGTATRAADADRIAGLQRDLRSAATASAQSAADAAAAGDLRDQNRQLLGLVERGVGVVGYLRGVVGRGVEVVSRRDAEVAAALGQIAADRAPLD